MMGISFLFGEHSSSFFGLIEHLAFHGLIKINQMSGEVNATGGGMVVLLSIVTCGIYALYWYYKMGERTDRIKGTPEGSTGLIYLLLSIFGLSIVSVCLIQDTINRGVGRF